MKTDRPQLLIPHSLSPTTPLSHALPFCTLLMPIIFFFAAPYFNPTFHQSTNEFFVLPHSKPPAAPGSDHMGWVKNWLENATQTRNSQKMSIVSAVIERSFCSTGAQSPIQGPTHSMRQIRKWKITEVTQETEQLSH